MLAAAHPNIRTFTGQGIDDPTAIIKADWTPGGFHAMIISPVSGAVFIDPYDYQTTTNYISYYKADYKKTISFFEHAPIQYLGAAARPAGGDVLAGVCIGTQLRTYRLAIACTNEYAKAATGLATPTKAQVLAKMATSLNRINGVYERELAIRMVLVANETDVIFVNAATDPFSGNNNAEVLIGESQTEIDARIGSANYDIGHTFSTGGGGLAGLGVVCLAGQKSRGITGSPQPAGDPYDIDFVAHEMGHQFGASHTFNSKTGNCDEPNWSGTTNAEPGSGSTIMAYAGICGSDNLQSNSDAQFHAVSLDQITAYTVAGTGNSCAVKTSTNNTPPVVNAGRDYTVPKSTPFSLTGSATDANGDALTYSWEEIDVEGPSTVWNNPSGDAPAFRSFVPRSSSTRFFPSLADVISGNTTIGEILPSYARIMHFRLTARDNRASGGGVCFDESAVTISGNSGPFVVTYPNATGIGWTVNDFKTITWDPAGTKAAPVSCANVKIELSTDGGLTFPTVILASTANDGIEEIQVPANVTNSARIRVTGLGNVFYDISNANFSIQNATAPQFVFNNPIPVTPCGAASVAATLKTAALNGFATPVNLSATGNPAGTTVTFNTNPVTPGGSTTVTLNNIAGLANGTYNVTVNGVAGAVTKARIIPFEINTVPTSPTGLSAPANGAIGVAVLPTFNWTGVAGAATYTLEISKNENFSALVQSIPNITTPAKVLTTPLADNTVYYWRVIAVNTCGISPPSVAALFKTGIATCRNSADVPKVISENGTPTVTSTITISAAAGVTMSDLNVVGLACTHAYMNDLTVTLKSPAGTSVVLFSEICPGGAVNYNFNLDDESTLAIPCPPTGNKTAKPENPLSAFDGENTTGVWTLTIKDNADQDGGSLTGWGLAFNNCAVIATSIATQLCPPAASTSLTADATGPTYQWQVNTGSGFVNIVNNANYAGGTTSTLQINNAPSSWNGYQYRCVVDGVAGTIQTIGFVTYWNGSVSNAWENPANWSCNAIPDANTEVIISSGTVVVKSAAFCRSIKVNPASSVTVNTGFKITVTH
jgi:subtilisin-like proprotein convertase family protein